MPVLAALESASLSEINASADLLTRVDRKYVLSADEHSLLTDCLPRTLVTQRARVLSIDGNRRFGYRSTYFDTAAQDSFRGAAHRRRRRFKVRLRQYLDSAECHLEVKTRGPRGTTVKQRQLVPWASAIAPSLDADGMRFVSECLHGDHIDLDVRQLRPAICTTYRRSTVWLPDADARVTIDTSLCWQLPDGLYRELEDFVIVETKSPTGGPTAVDRALWSQGCRPVRFSKFATGAVLLDPTLPANRWHRLIQHQLAAGTRLPATMGRHTS